MSNVYRIPDYKSQLEYENANLKKEVAKYKEALAKVKPPLTKRLKQMGVGRHTSFALKIVGWTFAGSIWQFIIFYFAAIQGESWGPPIWLGTTIGTGGLFWIITAFAYDQQGKQKNE